MLSSELQSAGTLCWVGSKHHWEVHCVLLSLLPYGNNAFLMHLPATRVHRMVNTPRGHASASRWVTEHVLFQSSS